MKTWKREVAGGMLLVTFGLVIWAFIGATFEQRLALLGLIFLPVLTFAALAFGVDWFGKHRARLRGGSDDRMDP